MNDPFYKSTKWVAKRAKIIRLDSYRDVWLWRRYRIAKPANTVHHIYPRKEFPEYALSEWNLISVSEETHNKLENRKTGELTELGKELQRKTIPGVDWRKPPLIQGSRPES